MEPLENIFTTFSPQSRVLIFLSGLLSCLGKVRLNLPRKTEAPQALIFIHIPTIPVPTGVLGIRTDPRKCLKTSFTIRFHHDFMFPAISIFSVKPDYSSSNQPRIHLTQVSVCFFNNRGEAHSRICLSIL